MTLIIKARVGWSKPLPRVYSVPALKIALFEVPLIVGTDLDCGYCGIRVL